MHKRNIKALMAGNAPGSSAALRICHLITRLDMGGSAENTLLTVIGLRERGYAVDLVCGRSDNPASPSETEALARGVRIIQIDELVRPVDPVRDAIALFRMVLLMKKRRYHLLHTHTSKAGIVGRIAGYIAGVPVVVHTPHGHIFYGYFSSLLTRFFTWLERIITRNTDALITLTNKEKQDYLARNIGTADRIHPILSGIDLRPFGARKTGRERLRESVGLRADDFVAGTVARLVPVKNHGLIIDAVARIRDRCPSLRCVWIGDGERRPVLENRIQTLGLADRFIFLGWRSDIARCLFLFDLFVMCSHNEGMGRAFIEAQASGVPVVGSRVGGVEEAIAEGKTGFLVDPLDSGGLAQVLERLYADREGLSRMSATCRSFVDPAFGKEVMVEKINALYHRLLSERNRS
ncbi:MAG: glycosyltransferase family 4 protein [Chitinispirillaceae bacterium]|nr:glycosyltransferase family 4 protein [Chitinispirillaceae bacterium]